MQANREEGRLNWIYNVIEGRKEVEDVIYRTPLGRDGDEGFLLLPNLHWDRKTIDALHLLAIVERRDLWSLRDLKKKHLPWLRHMRAKLIDATVNTYPQIEEYQLKLFCHYSRHITISTFTLFTSRWKQPRRSRWAKRSAWIASSSSSIVWRETKRKAWKAFQ